MLELGGIIILGIFAQWLAWRFRVPSILPLIITGLIMGPLSTLWSADGNKWIEPIFDESTQEGLFPNRSLFYFVSLAIGIILFEGGLTLKRSEIRGVGPAILKLITIGSLVTFVGGGLAAHFLMNLSWQISFLFSGLIIVTGPTVIAPILQNVPLTRNVATVLKWEGILIDPIGALVAVLVFEFIVSGGGVSFTSTALFTFLKIIVTGVVLGAGAAFGLFYLIKKELVPHYLLNVFTLALVLLAFVGSDALAHESGLLTVVIMGMVLGNLEVPRLKEILSFKESLSVLLISVLFVLLAANIDLKDLQLLLDVRELWLFLFIVFILRPVGVFLSTRGSGLSWAEKTFISWMGPRGIVAAGVASLFGLILTTSGVPGGQYITPLVFMIVLGTVLLNATTARAVARLLGVIQSASDGILFIGANQAALLIAKYLQKTGRHVVLVDSNETYVKNAVEEGLEAFNINIYTDELSEHFELVDMGYLIAMTASQQVNEYAVQKYQRLFGEKGTFRLLTANEMRLHPEQLPAQGIFSYTDDFLNINEVARDYSEIHEEPLKDRAHFEKLMKQLSKEENKIPLFLKMPDGFLEILVPDMKKFSIGEGYALVYLGQKL